MNKPKSVKRIAKWNCPDCGERFVWADIDVDDNEWIGTIRLIQHNHRVRCSFQKANEEVE